MPVLPRRLGVLLSLLLAFVAVPGTAASAGLPRIVGGASAQQQYPFIAEIQFRKNFPGAPFEHHCAGVLVAATWVLTAAHCVEIEPGRPVNVAQFRVRVGSVDRTSGGTELGIVQVVRHPLWEQGRTADIALVRLAAAVPHPVVDIGVPAARLTLLGWGATCAVPSNCVDFPATLKQLQVATLDDSRCVGISNFSPDGFICADSPAGAGVCMGDSGGPALVWADGVWSVAGVLSNMFPDPAVCGERPVAYTDANWHRRWIHRTMSTTFWTPLFPPWWEPPVIKLP